MLCTDNSPKPTMQNNKRKTNVGRLNASLNHKQYSRSSNICEIRALSKILLNFNGRMNREKSISKEI